MVVEVRSRLQVASPFEVHRVPVQNCRETFGVHNCDKRHPKSWVVEKFPLYTFEKGFTEEVSFLAAGREST